VLPNARVGERININSLNSEILEGKEIPHAEINSVMKTVLLECGAIGRDFITRECCNQLKLSTLRLLYPIRITSIHGEEMAKDAIHIPS
jgi:hypothetical protein